MAPSDQITRYGFDDVLEAPSAAGLYAWYGRPAATPADWADEADLRSFLAHHTHRYVTPTLVLDAQTTFLRTWSGELQETTSSAFDVAIGLVGTDPAGRSSLSAAQGTRRDALSGAAAAVLADATMRESLMEALNAAIPILASPLYVGISKNLRTRLRSHTREFDRLVDSKPTPDELRALMEDDRNFAARALSRGFRADFLEVWCMPVAPADDPEQGRALAVTVEYFLNRWHHPPFGRR